MQYFILRSKIIISFETKEIKMVAVSSRRSIRDPDSDSKATLCHLGNEIAFGSKRGGNGKCETAILPFFFASPRHFGLVFRLRDRGFKGF